MDKSPAKEASSLTAKDLEEEVVKDKLIGNFTEYMSTNEFSPDLYRKYLTKLNAS